MTATIEPYFVPTTLFRFRSLKPDTLTHEIEALREDYIFCPRFDELNDASKLLQRSRRYPTIAAKLEEKAKALGVASFTETPLFEPMWAYYADNFKGICIAYSLSRLLKSLPDQCQLARMGYNETPPLLSALASDLDERARAVLCAKTVRWSHEREWRLFAPTRGPVKYADSKSVRGVYLGKRMLKSTRDRVLKELDKRKIPAFIMNTDSYRLSFTKRTI